MVKRKLGEFEKNTIKVFVMAMIANVCGYLFQIVLGHTLTVEDFGILNSLIALMSIMNSPGSVMAALTTKCIAEANQDVKLIYASVLRATLALQILLIFLGVCLTKVLLNSLGVDDYRLIIEIILVSTVALMSFPLYGILQGLKKFNAYGIQEIILQASKVILCVLFVYCGYGLLGALFGIAFSYVLECLYCFLKTKDFLPARKRFTLQDSLNFFKNQKQYLGKAIFIRIIILIYLNMDVLLVKAHYSELETGIFSAGMVLAKIGMYLTTALVVPLFPMVVENTDRKSRFRLFFKSILYGMGTCWLYHMALIIWGTYFINLLFGVRYIEAIPILPYICPYVICITGLMILMNFFMAANKMSFFTISMFIGFFIIILITSYIKMTLIHMFIFLSVILGFILIVNILYAVGAVFMKK